MGSPSLVAATAKWGETLGQDDPDKVLALYTTDAVLWGTLSPTVRSDRAALRDYFVSAFKILPGLKVSFGEQLIRVYGNTAVNTGYYTFAYTSSFGPAKALAAISNRAPPRINKDRVRILSSPIFVANVEYERQSGRIYKILGSWDWCADPGVSIPSEITKITSISDAMVAGCRIDDHAVDDLLNRVVLVMLTMRISIAIPGEATSHLRRQTLGLQLR